MVPHRRLPGRRAAYSRPVESVDVFGYHPSDIRVIRFEVKVFREFDSSPRVEERHGDEKGLGIGRSIAGSRGRSGGRVGAEAESQIRRLHGEAIADELLEHLRLQLDLLLDGRRLLHLRVKGKDVAAIAFAAVGDRPIVFAGVV